MQHETLLGNSCMQKKVSHNSSNLKDGSCSTNFVNCLEGNSMACSAKQGKLFPALLFSGVGENTTAFFF